MPRHIQQRSPDSVSAGDSAPDPDFLADTSWVPDAVTDTPPEAQGAAAETAADIIPPELVAQALGPSFQAAFHFLATVRGEHWELQEFEKTALVLGWTPIAQYLLAKLGSQEQIMVGLAVTSTMAIVGGKLAQDATKRASSKASTRTPARAVSPASSASATEAKPPAPASSFEEQDDS